jgi:hypothetical protein
LRPVTKLLLAFVWASGIALTNGCMSFSDRGFAPVTDEIARQAPGVQLRKEFAVSIGPALINAVDLITVGSEFDFSKVDKVQVAVYEIAFDSDLSGIDVEDSLRARDRSLTWETVVKVRETFERTWVLIGINEQFQRIEAVSVFSMEQGGLVLIHVDGELEEMIEFAFDPVRGNPGGFSFS